MSHMKKLAYKYKCIMLIDDNEIDNFINEKIIQSVLFAENIYIHTSSRSALEFLKNIEHTQNKFPNELIPQYIFLDINMPLLDGFQFLDEFEKFPKEFSSKSKVVMLTTSLNPFDIEKSNQYKNVVKFVHKPLTEVVLGEL